VISFRPIELWPGELTRLRKASPFKASYSDTMNLLRFELTKLGAQHVVVQLALPPSQIRRDGLPYESARPAHPGVILSFKSKGGDLRFPCDRFDDWQDNLRAIALALEALRKVDRYGVVRRNEQYRGWVALPGPMVTPAVMTVDEAAQFIAAAATPLLDQLTDAELRVKSRTYGAAGILADREVFGSLYKLAARIHHPDAGDSTQWAKLQEAAQLLRRHHGL
jgi:hypothetical protein